MLLNCSSSSYCFTQVWQTPPFVFRSQFTQVEYTGIIDVENEYEVSGAIAINKGILDNGEMLIPE